MGAARRAGVVLGRRGRVAAAAAAATDAAPRAAAKRRRRPRATGGMARTHPRAAPYAAAADEAAMAVEDCCGDGVHDGVLLLDVR